MKSVNNPLKNLLVFLSVCFLLPLLCTSIMELEFINNQPTVKLILFGLEGASPAIASLVVWITQGKHSLMTNLHEKYISNLCGKCILLGLLIPFAILTIARIVTYCLEPDASFINPISMKKLLIIAWALVAEELGWRGYLQPELEKRLSPYIVPLLIGIIWTLWHYHFILSGSMKIPLFPFLLGCIFESYGYYVICKLSKNNIIPASLWHFTGNLFFNLYHFDPSWNQDNTTFYWIASLMYGLNVVLYVYYVKEKHKHQIASI